MTTAERRTDDPAAVLDSVPLGAFVGGTWTDTGRTFPVEDPATGEVLAAVADCGPDEARAALDAAAAAQPALAATAPRERAELLRRIHELLLRDRERLATIITLEMGKPVAESRGEVAYAAEFFRWFSEEACRIEGSYATSPDGRGRILVTRRPVGPCLLITPWNFPLAMGARKIAPALAAGCTSVVKPAEQTPLTMLALAALLEEAGVPAGAVSVLPASDPEAVADPVLADPRLRKLSFTGSTEVGRHLIRRSADQVLRVSLELGGNAPFLVFEDADLDAAVEGALVAKMRNGGEACTAANRFLVHDAVADEFARRLAERMAALVVGRGTEPGVDVGPLIDGPARDRVVGLIEEYRGAPRRRRAGADGRGGPARGRLLPRADRADRRAGRGRDDPHRDLRAGRADPALRRHRRRRGRRQRHPLRPGLLRLHPGHRPGARRVRGARGRDGRAQPGCRVRPGGAVRGCQAVGARPRGRPGRHRRVPRDHLRGPAPLIPRRHHEIRWRRRPAARHACPVLTGRAPVPHREGGGHTMIDVAARTPSNRRVAAVPATRRTAVPPAPAASRLPAAA
jgi:succinate-semialdehyde dehydrogenase/glutarate-semialdehyde dehydrogenase